MISIEIERKDRQLFDEIVNQHEDAFSIYDPEGFVDSTTLFMAITLTPVLIPALSKIFIELIKKNREFTLKVDGIIIETKGYSEKAMNQFLEKIFKTNQEKE